VPSFVQRNNVSEPGFLPRSRMARTASRNNRASLVRISASKKLEARNADT